MVPSTIRTLNTTYAADSKTTTQPKTLCRKAYAATQHLMLLMMGYVPETCLAKNILIKLPFCIKLSFHMYYRVSNKMLVIRSLNIVVVPGLDFFSLFLPASRPQDVRAYN